eukprot:scaffold228467_cov22-Attheya_sp.AAC.2
MAKSRSGGDGTQNHRRRIVQDCGVESFFDDLSSIWQSNFSSQLCEGDFPRLTRNCPEFCC